MIFIIMVALEYNIKWIVLTRMRSFFLIMSKSIVTLKVLFCFLSSNHAARASCMGDLERNLVLFPD